MMCVNVSHTIMWTRLILGCVQTVTFNVGEAPGAGRYRCVECTWEVELASDLHRLPPCGGGCENLFRLTRFERITVSEG